MAAPGKVFSARKTSAAAPGVVTTSRGERVTSSFSPVDQVLAVTAVSPSSMRTRRSTRRTAAVSPGARCTVRRAGSQPMKVATTWRFSRCRVANRKRPSRPVAAPSVVPASCTLAKGTGSPSASTT